MTTEIPFLQVVYWNNSLQKWLLAFLLVFAAAIIGKIVGWFFKLAHKITEKTQYRIDSILVDMIEEPIVYIILFAGLRFSITTLTLPKKLIAWVDKSIHVVIALLVGWMLVRLIDAIIETYVKPWVEKTDNDLDDQLLPLARKGIKLIIWSMAIVVGMNNAGYDVGAIVAGLGIGGLTFALAAKDTLSNLFGGFTIYADRPFRINDRIKVQGYDGNVKEIGLRSTRIITLDGRMVTMPNMTFTDKPVENITSEPSRRVTVMIGLTYNMGHAGIDKAMTTLKDICAANPSVDQDVKLGFTGFGSSSLDITLIYCILKAADILKTQTEINLAILKKFEEANIDFAFPTQTIYSINQT